MAHGNKRRMVINLCLGGGFINLIKPKDLSIMFFILSLLFELLFLIFTISASHLLRLLNLYICLTDY